MESLFGFLRRPIPPVLFKIFGPVYHFALAYLGAVIYGFPSRKLIVIGVTGTNGKTTVVHLIHHILNNSGIKTGMVSSLQFCVGDKCEKNLLKMTMPGRFYPQKFLRRCVKEGTTHVVLEVTSQGVLQFRHRGIKFDYAVLTNVTPEHIEAHGGFEKYRDSKLKFFGYSAKNKGATAVVNTDDPSVEMFLSYPFEKKIKYRGADLDHFNPLLGDFNRANVAAAVKVAESVGASRDKTENALKNFPGVPGRLEFIQREPFAVVIDYAHTPDALRKVYKTLRSAPIIVDERSKLICVLGAAGGGRDKWKRPEVGKIAAEFCNEIILTNEDPYDEKPETILDDIELGFPRIPNYKSQTPDKFQNRILKILNRKDAIRKALSNARSNDTIIITGKGAEPWIMGPNGTKISWDDRQVSREELAKLNG